MTIFDLYNAPIEVTDLDAAIIQAEEFKDCHLPGAGQLDFNLALSLYWNDLYQKLLSLKTAREQ